MMIAWKRTRTRHRSTEMQYGEDARDASRARLCSSPYPLLLRPLLSRPSCSFRGSLKRSSLCLKTAHSSKHRLPFLLYFGGKCITTHYRVALNCNPWRCPGLMTDFAYAATAAFGLSIKPDKHKGPVTPLAAPPPTYPPPTTHPPRLTAQAGHARPRAACGFAMPMPRDWWPRPTPARR